MTWRASRSPWPGYWLESMDEVAFRCPYCGEVNEATIEWPVQGELIQDCWVCCRPIHLTVWRDEWGDPQVTAAREDG